MRVEQERKIVDAKMLKNAAKRIVLTATVSGYFFGGGLMFERRGKAWTSTAWRKFGIFVWLRNQAHAFMAQLRVDPDNPGG